MNDTLSALLNRPSVSVRPSIPAAPAADPLGFSLAVGNVYTEDGRQIAGSRAVIRTDTGNALGVVGMRWAPIQPAEMRELAETVGKAAGAPNAHPSVMDGGRDIVIQMRGEEYTVGSDVLRREVWVTGNNTGAAPVRASARVSRKVCSNGLFLPIGNSRTEWVSVRHTKSGAARMRALCTLGKQLRETHETYAETFLRLMLRPVDYKGGELAAYYERILPRPTAPGDGATIQERSEHREELERVNSIRRDWLGCFMRELDARDAGAEAGPSLWLAMNSVTNWAQHRMPVRGARQDAERRTYSNLPGGRGYELTQTAFAEARALLN